MHLLRILEYLTSLAITEDKLRVIVCKLLRPKHVSLLTSLILQQRFRLSLASLKIIENLLALGTTCEELHDEFLSLTSDLPKEYSSPQTKTVFGGNAFLLFLYRVYLTMSVVHKETEDSNEDERFVGCAIRNLLSDMMYNKLGQSWKDLVIPEVLNAIQNPDTLPLEEFEALTSLFDDVKIKGIRPGEFGVTNNGKKFAILGCTTKWPFLALPGSHTTDYVRNDLKLTHSLEDKKDHVVVQYYDDKNTEIHPFEFLKPEEATLIPRLDEGETPAEINSVGKKAI